MADTSRNKWEIKWEEKELRCYHYGYGPERYSVIDYEPRLPGYIDALSGITQQWFLFDYSTDICDGTQWKIDIRVGKHKFKKRAVLPLSS